MLLSLEIFLHCISRGTEHCVFEVDSIKGPSWIGARDGVYIQNSEPGLTHCPVSVGVEELYALEMVQIKKTTVIKGLS